MTADAGGVRGISFERRTGVNRYLDPREGFAPTEHPIEIRIHPLTGHTTRLARIGMPDRDPYEMPPVIAESAIPIFAPPLVTQITPRFDGEGLAERYQRGRSTLFPNLNPYDEYSPVVAVGDRPLVEPNDLDATDVADALTLLRDFFGDLEAPHDVGVVGWNFWPASSSSIPHPHLQGISSGRVPARQRAEMDGEVRFRSANAEDFWDAYVDVERDGERWVGEHDGWAAIVDFAPKSVVPETVLVPVSAHPPHIQGMSDGDAASLAGWFCRMAAAHADLGVSAFNALVHPTAPIDGHTTRMRARFMPRVYVVEALHSSDWTWVQMGTDEALTSILPEEWAERLRSVV